MSPKNNLGMNCTRAQSSSPCEGKGGHLVSAFRRVTHLSSVCLGFEDLKKKNVMTVERQNVFWFQGLVQSLFLAHCSLQCVPYYLKNIHPLPLSYLSV